MRMLVNVILPFEPFNSRVKSITVGQEIRQIVEEIKLESIYFTEIDGHRSVVIVMDLDDAYAVPTVAEPWHLNFVANYDFRTAMTPKDLLKAVILVNLLRSRLKIFLFIVF